MSRFSDTQLISLLTDRQTDKHVTTTHKNRLKDS